MLKRLICFMSRQINRNKMWKNGGSEEERKTIRKSTEKEENRYKGKLGHYNLLNSYHVSGALHMVAASKGFPLNQPPLSLLLQLTPDGSD